MKPTAVNSTAGIIVNIVHSMENNPCNCPLLPEGNSLINRKGAKLIVSNNNPIINRVKLLIFL